MYNIIIQYYITQYYITSSIYIECICTHSYIHRSLRLGSPLWRILGTLPLHSPHASYLLTNKYVIIRPLSDPRVLVGYLGSDERLHPLLMESILLSLRLWSDESALRHMTAGLHLQIAGHVVLGVNLIDLSPFQSQLSG